MPFTLCVYSCLLAFQKYCVYILQEKREIKKIGFCEWTAQKCLISKYVVRVLTGIGIFEIWINSDVSKHPIKNAEMQKKTKKTGARVSQIFLAVPCDLTCHSRSPGVYFFVDPHKPNLDPNITGRQSSAINLREKLASKNAATLFCRLEYRTREMNSTKK